MSRDFALIPSDVFPTTSQGSNGGALQLAIRDTESAGTTPRELRVEDVEFTPDGWAARCPRCGFHEILVALEVNPDTLVAQREVKRLRRAMGRIADQLRRRNGYEL